MHYLNKLKKHTTKFIVLVVALLIVIGVPIVASAAEEPGLWYFDKFNIQKAHDAGINGKGVTIAIMDSPINTDALPLRGANIEVRPSTCLDDSGSPLSATSTASSGYFDAMHGTAIASFVSGTGAANPGQAGVKGVAPGARVIYYPVAFGNNDTGLFCKQAKSDAFDVENALAVAINDAIDSGADIISVSLGVNETESLASAIARAHREGVVILGGLPNSTLNGAGDWPSAANGVVSVQSIDSSAKPQLDLNGLPSSFPWTTVAGPGVELLAPGQKSGDWNGQSINTGTSYATPIVAGFLALVLQKYPNATGNQLIQTLIRNTGVADHELVRDDKLGYGIASATHMLEVDPTKYDDVNPLLFEGDNPPSIADSTKKNNTSTTELKSESGLPLVPILIGAGALVVIVVVAGVVILLVRRKSRKAQVAATPSTTPLSNIPEQSVDTEEKPTNPFDNK